MREYTEDRFEVNCWSGGEAEQFCPASHIFRCYFLLNLRPANSKPARPNTARLEGSGTATFPVTSLILLNVICLLLIEPAEVRVCTLNEPNEEVEPMFAFIEMKSCIKE